MTVVSCWGRRSSRCRGLAAGSVAAMGDGRTRPKRDRGGCFRPTGARRHHARVRPRAYSQLTGLTIAGAVAIGAILVACLGRFVAGRRGPGSGGSPWPALLLALLPACLGVLLYSWALASGFDSAAGDDPSLKTGHLREILENSHRWLDRARLATWLVVGADRDRHRDARLDQALRSWIDSRNADRCRNSGDGRSRVRVDAETGRRSKPATGASRGNRRCEALRGPAPSRKMSHSRSLDPVADVRCSNRQVGFRRGRPPLFCRRVDGLAEQLPPLASGGDVFRPVGPGGCVNSERRWRALSRIFRRGPTVCG